jgi:hypothetical protein
MVMMVMMMMMMVSDGCDNDDGDDNTDDDDYCFPVKKSLFLFVISGWYRCKCKEQRRTDSLRHGHAVYKDWSFI